MKNIWILLLLIIFPIVGFSQQGNFVTEIEYDYRKMNNTLVGDEIILSQGMINPNSVTNGVHFVHNLNNYSKTSGCSGYTDPLGPTISMSASDDGTSGSIPLQFTYCFYGDSYTSFYVNGNGNISFGSQILSYSSSAFPSTGNKMIAAFWADFDLGQIINSANGQYSCGGIYVTTTPTAAIINWVNVGYYDEHCDKKNTCQIIITNGLDPLVQGGNTAIFYDDMQWTTGDLSGGNNGFGGTPATCGANRGNNIDYFQIGRFDHAGTDYDGPNGANDGVDFLDHKSYIFDFCSPSNNGNLPPVPTNTNFCDTIGVCHSGDTLDISFPFIAPENNQTNSITFSAPTLNNVQILSNTSGYSANLTLRIIGALETIGVHDILVTATDNYSTPGVTALTYRIEVTDPSLAFPISPLVSYTPSCAPVTFAVSNTYFDGFNWSTGSTTSSTTINSAFHDTLSVVVKNGGCIFKIDTLVTVPSTPSFNLQGSLFYCPINLNTHLILADSLGLDSAHWKLNGSVIATGYNVNLTSGTYIVTIWDTSGFCSKDTTIHVSVQPNLVLENDKYICQNTHAFTGNTGGGGSGTWTYLNNPTPPPTFSNNNLNNTVTFPFTGTYTLVYTESTCQDKDTVVITWEDAPVYGLPSNILACPEQPAHLIIKDSLNMSSISWGLSSQALDTLYSANLTAGTYTIHATSLHNCPGDTTIIVSTITPVQIVYSGAVDCNDSTVYLDQNIGNSNGQWTCTNNQNVTFTPSNNITTTIVVPEFGDYTFVFTESTCNDDDTVTIKFRPDAYVDLIDYKICSGFDQQILTNIFLPQFINTIEWTKDNDPNVLGTSNTYTTSSAGIYYCTVTGLCTSYTDSSIITVKTCDLQIPNTFSPNGDGSNETFELLTEDLDFFKSFNISIVNRWGNVIANYNVPDFIWNGKDKNGNIVPTGVYFYSINSTTIEDTELNRQGFIQVFSDK